MRWVRWITGAFLALAVAAAGVAGWRWYERGAVERSHIAALAAARQFTVDFVSISAATVDKDIERIVGMSTGDFHNEYTKGRAQVRAAVVENEVSSQGNVLRSALVSGDHDSAVVLVAVDATVKNVKAPAGRPSHYRIKVDMVKENDRWLVSRLEFVG
jgi:Mce-associated membrane protein